MRLIFIQLLLFSIFTGCQTKTVQGPYVLEEVDLVPEGIAYSEKEQKFYLTSVAKSKIVTVDRAQGSQDGFIEKEAHGFSPGVGIVVDDERNEVLALGGYYMRENTLTTLFKFDLTTGALIQKYQVQDTGKHFLNDLILDRSGNAYITDTNASSLYVLNREENNMGLFFKSDEIQYPNGIAISTDNSKLYVASYTHGIRIIDLQTKTIINEADTTSASRGIDGLEYYKGNLYAIQNGIQTNGDNFRKLILNDAGDKLIGHEVIDERNPALNLPLTFCIADNQAVVIANSNLQFLDQVNLTITDREALKPTKLLVYDL